MDVDYLIIGAGLSGLHTAYELEKQKSNYLLVESRNRLGGRILSKPYSPSHTKKSSSRQSSNVRENAFDLGPSWFWPWQYRLEMLSNELGISADIFEQFSTGSSIYEDSQGNLEKNFQGISMEGSYRLAGGISQFISSLQKHIPEERILINSTVTRIEQGSNNTKSTLCMNGKEKVIKSRFVIIALPPRNALMNIRFKPDLKSSRRNELNSLPTWMASQAKFVAVYEKPFWRENGFSGDAISQRGPLREIHDASTAVDSGKDAHFALFGFVGVPVLHRKNKQQIIDGSLEQLVRLFGEVAGSPLRTFYIDWSLEEFTASPEDLLNGGHAEKSLSRFTEWNDQLIWSGTETADVGNEHNNGYLEGALESSIRTLKFLSKNSN